MKKTFLLFAVAAALSPVFSAQTAEPMKKLLVVTTTAGFRHASIPTAEKIISRLAADSGRFSVEFVQQPEGKPAALKPGASVDEQTVFKAAQAEWEQKLKQALLKLSPAE